MQAIGDLGGAFSEDVRIAVIEAGQPAPSGSDYSTASTDLPVEACRSGCDLVFHALFYAAPRVGTGAILTYEATASTWYSGYGTLDDGFLTVSITDATPPIPIFLMAVATAIAALLLGVLIGPRSRLGRRWQAVPTVILIGLLVYGALWPS